MSAVVVDLDSRRPHFVGFGKCRGCRFEDIVVAPLPVLDRYECPHCKAMTIEVFPSREESRAAMRVVPKLRIVRR